jgi:hypothetical protein
VLTLSRKLREVKDDISNKVMLASFAINANTTIMLLTPHFGGAYPRPQPPEVWHTTYFPLVLLREMERGMERAYYLLPPFFQIIRRFGFFINI